MSSVNFLLMEHSVNVRSSGVGKQAFKGMLPEHLYPPQQSGKWPLSRDGASSHLSGLSSQSSAGFPNLFDPSSQLQAAFESPYRMKAQQLRLHQEALDEQVTCTPSKQACADCNVKPVLHAKLTCVRAGLHSMSSMSEALQGLHQLVNDHAPAACCCILILAPNQH